MAYIEELAARVGNVLGDRGDLDSKKMFGGIAFMVNGNMACGIVGNELMVRVGPIGYDEAVSRPHARPMDFTGKPMKGMVFVAPEGIDTDVDLARWVQRGVDYAASLPAK